MSANAHSEQARLVLAEVTRRLQAPNSDNIEQALSLIEGSRQILREAAEDDSKTCHKDLDQTLKGLCRLAEQTAGFYLGLAAMVSSRAGSYNAAGESFLPTLSRSLSVSG